MDLILKRSSITFLGTAFNGLLGAIFYILVARVLGPADFGLFILAVTTLTLVADITDLGTDTGLVKFVGKYIESQKDKAYIFLKLALQIRVLVSLVVIIIGWVLAPVIASYVFQKSELVLPLRLAFLGVGSVQIFSFSLSSFQALQKFFIWSLIQVFTNLLRLVIVILLFFLGLLQLETTMLTYILMPLLGFLASLLFLPRKFLFAKNTFKEAKEFFHYSKWIALTVVLAAISSKLDIFISGRLLSLEEVGYYGAAIQLVIIIPQIMRAIETVIAPKMAAIKSTADAISYFKKSQLYVSILAFLGLLSAPIVILLIPVLYGAQYALVVPLIFIILFLGSLIFLLTVPINAMVIYFYGYPKLYSFVSAGNVFLIAIGGWILISNFGIYGAAYTFLMGNLFNLIVPFIWLMLKTKNEK